MKVLQKFQKQHLFWTPVVLFFLKPRRGLLKFEEFIYGGCRKLSALTFKMRLTAKYVVKRALIQVTRLKGTTKYYILGFNADFTWNHCQRAKVGNSIFVKTIVNN